MKESIGMPPPLVPYQPKRTVLVITPCYNHARFLRECVESVVAQTYKDWAMVLVDDGSTDNSWAEMARLACAHPNKDISVVGAGTRGTRGSATARNLAVEMGPPSDFIVPLDSDDMLEPDHLNQMLAVAEPSAEERPGWVYCDYRYLDDEGNSEVVLMSDDAQKGVREQNRLAHGGSVIARPMWEALGGYNEELRFSEDWDFWIRADAAGYRSARCPLPLYRYRRHPGSKSRTGPSVPDRKKAIMVVNPGLYG